MAAMTTCLRWKAGVYLEVVKHKLRKHPLLLRRKAKLRVVLVRKLMF